MLFINTGKKNKSEDDEIISLYKETGDNLYVGILFERYSHLAFGVCMKYLKNEEEAKDSVQQVFLKAITELQKYKVEYFKSWIYMVAKNHCLMILRDRQGKIPAELTDRMTIQTEEKEKAEFIKQDITLDLMSDSLKELNTEQQQCVTLFYLEKKSYQEIADQSNFTVLQVKSHIQNGKRNLKIIMDKMHAGR